MKRHEFSIALRMGFVFRGYLPIESSRATKRSFWIVRTLTQALDCMTDGAEFLQRFFDGAPFRFRVEASLFALQQCKCTYRIVYGVALFGVQPGQCAQ